MNEDQFARLYAVVEERFRNHGADHDYEHLQRVVALALHLQSREGGELEVVHAAALLHDISDHKLNGGVLNDNGRVTRELLEELGVEDSFIRKVAAIVDAVSFKGNGVKDMPGSLELSIVRDADRLDAIGAIGIARAFHYGGSRNRPLFEAERKPETHTSFEKYATNQSHTLNHFYEKLLLLKDRMETREAQRMAEQRHHLMDLFVKSFQDEWFLKDI